MKKWGILFFLLVTVLCSCMANAEQVSVPEQPDESSMAAPVVMPSLTPLAVGTRGEGVLAMQRRLAQLGFFYTSEDGIYGANTQAAVLEFENYLRLLEQDELDRLEAERAANATPTPQASTSDEPVTTPEPTPAPTPQTPADGTADLDMLEILFGDADALYRRDARVDDEGEDVLRIQRRLVALNYLISGADGRFGVNTEAAVKAFQKVYELDQTGIMDRATQALLFSEDAVRAEHPAYRLLSMGVSGDDVKAVQQQLINLGFMTGKAGGTYDARTEEGVKRLEIYLHQIEAAANAPTASTAPTNTVQPSAEPTHAEVSTLAQEKVALPTGVEDMLEDDPEINPYGELPEGSAALPEDGYQPTGKVTAETQELLLEEGIPIYTTNVRAGDTGNEAQRVQRRLYALGYLTANGVDGIFGNRSELAVKSFQNRNHMEQTGIADQMTQLTLFSEDAVRSIKLYRIKVSVKDQRVYVYTHDEQDQYNVLVQTFVCSTGTKSHPTPLGTFTNTGPGARWHYFKKFKCWAQYAFYIDGDILFHSVLYSDQDVNTLNKSSVKNLGKRASHGCVRLAVEDAEWIYKNCEAGTTVIVY